MKTKVLIGVIVISLLGGSMSFSPAAAQGDWGIEKGNLGIPEVRQHEEELAARNYAPPHEERMRSKEQGGFNCSQVVAFDYLESECEALVAFYHSTGGAGWTNNNGWLSDPNLGNWHGLHFTKPADKNLLDDISLGNNQLSGNIPAELGNLTNLETLSLDRNQLSGSIPAEIGSLTGLRHLDLSYNYFSGNVPASINNLTALCVRGVSDPLLCSWYDTDFGHNFLNVPQPEPPLAFMNTKDPDWAATQTQYYFNCNTVEPTYQKSECEVLVALFINTDGPNWTRKDNWLKGTNLSTWYGLDFNPVTNSLRGMDLRDNQLSGNIPAELGNLTNLETLYLSSNQLSGNIPAELGKLKNLKYLVLSDNQLSGTIPSQLGSLTNLISFYLADNQLSGSIPGQLGNLTNLNFLHLNRNQLSGSIPGQLGNLIKLIRLDLSYNPLSGSIPALLGSLTNLETLYLSSNQLSGNIPGQLGSLTNLMNLSLRNNQLSGSIPGQLGSLTNLTYLNLSYNQLSGRIPDEIGGLTNLLVLNLSYNHLWGNVPASITRLTKLCVREQGLPDCLDWFDTDFGHNMLFVPQPDPPQSFMYLKDPDWAATQRPPIRNYLPAILK